MEQKKYDTLIDHLNKGVYHYYISEKYEVDIQETENNYPESEFNWFIDSHYEYLLHYYDESIQSRENPRNKLNNSVFLQGLTSGECEELLHNFKDSLYSVYEKDYKEARKALIRNCSWFSLIFIIICIAIYCAVYAYPDEAKTISKFGKLLFYGMIYFGFMVYYKTKNYLQERKVYQSFKQGLETNNL